MTLLRWFFSELAAIFTFSMSNKNDAEWEPTLVPEPPVIEPTVPPTAPLPPEPIQPTPPPPKYLWDTPINTRHTVRVLCDEEGLTAEQKNTLCATVGAESEWMHYYPADYKIVSLRGTPVIRENKKNGKVWSTDWGVIQLNDHYWISPGKDFPSVEYVLANPEACIRWMCKMWKTGHRNLWVGYTSGRYKSYLWYH